MKIAYELRSTGDRTVGVTWGKFNGRSFGYSDILWDCWPLCNWIATVREPHGTDCRQL